MLNENFFTPSCFHSTLVAVFSSVQTVAMERALSTIEVSFTIRPWLPGVFQTSGSGLEASQGNGVEDLTLFRFAALRPQTNL